MRPKIGLSIKLMFFFIFSTVTFNLIWRVMVFLWFTCLSVFFYVGLFSHKFNSFLDLVLYYFTNRRGIKR